MGNDRLRTAMAKARVDVEAVSSRTGVDPKTVQRWLGGRLPHARHRWAVSELLDEEETYLWPETTNARRSTEASRAELVELYPFRSAVPVSLWWDLFSRARQQIGVLVYAANFLQEQHPDLNDLLREKAAAGCEIRIALGDPTAKLSGPAEPRSGSAMGSRPAAGLPCCTTSRSLACRGIEVHLHRTTLYNSIYRADEELLVNAHVWGVNAYRAPVMHLRRLTAGGLFDAYAASFEAVWATSELAPAFVEA